MPQHVVTLFKTQTSRNSVYVSHECTPYIFYCLSNVPCKYTGGVQDMKTGDHSCGLGCPTQNICLKPDRSEADIGKSSKGLDPLIALVWDIKPPNLRCIYNVDNIDTPSQINALKRLFPHEQVDHVMRAFCGGTSEQCTFNVKLCSKLKSLDESGVMCREWLSSLPTDELRDSVRREFCLNNNTDDCKCINRSKQPDFIKLRNGMDAQTLASTRCWYKPCENNSNILLDVEQKQQCIANVCQNIINAHARGNIDINTNTSNINCSFTKQQMAQADSERNKILYPKSPKKDNDSTFNYKSIGIYIAIGVIVASLIILTMIKLYTRRSLR